MESHDHASSRRINVGNSLPCSVNGVVGCETETGEILFIRKGPLRQIQRQVVVVAGKICVDFVLSIADGIDSDSETRRPVIREGVLSVVTGQVLLIPAHAEAQ